MTATQISYRRALLRWGLVIVFVASLAALSQALPARARAFAAAWQRIQSASLSERTTATLTQLAVVGGTPELELALRAAEHLEPVARALGPFELQIAVIPRQKSQAHRKDLTRDDLFTGGAAGLLLQRLTPAGWITFAPAARFQNWLDQSAPGQLAPEAQLYLAGKEVFVFLGFEDHEIAAIDARVAEILGIDLLTAGPREPFVHILLWTPLADRIRAGDPAVAAFQRLLR